NADLPRIDGYHACMGAPLRLLLVVALFQPTWNAGVKKETPQSISPVDRGVGVVTLALVREERYKSTSPSPGVQVLKPGAAYRSSRTGRSRRGTCRSICRVLWMSRRLPACTRRRRCIVAALRYLQISHASKPTPAAMASVVGSRTAAESVCVGSVTVEGVPL